jgi:hypothetical protein
MAHRIFEMTEEEIRNLPGDGWKPLLLDYVQSLTDDSDILELRNAYIACVEAGVIKPKGGYNGKKST